jgi:hypothetical protein
MPTDPTTLTDEEFERQTLDLIQREFGPKGLVRFIRTFRSGQGDYTAERDAINGNLTLDQIWKEMPQRGLTK